MKFIFQISYLLLDPSNIGIYGNEKVDKSAKESLNLEVTDFKIPFNNLKPVINKYVLNKW